ncbi:MAG: ABC transporter permease [Candidatus Fermentibacteraceae bacterium]|nr:ABC transporter permease [Candidatus Fermentibacteraceae bacterium]
MSDWNISRLRLLMESLVSKDLKVRYKRSILGFGWFLLKPLFSMIVYYFAFTRILRFGGAIPHFSLFLLTGLLPWNFFSSSLSATTSSLLDNHRLIRSIYFPRMSLPIAEVLANLIHLVLALVVLEAVLIIFGHTPGLSIVLLIPAILLFTIMTIGAGMLLSIGNVFYRDVKQFVEVLLLAWFYASPIIYPLDSIGVHIIESPGLIQILRFNPVAGFMEIMHSILYAGTWPAAWCWISLSAWSIVFLILGSVVFRKAEPVVVKEL